jgi:hypothetical protein
MSEHTSILKGTLSNSDALKQLFLPQTMQRTKQALEQFARFIDGVENLVLNGSIISVERAKVNVTPELIKSEAPIVFEELKSIVEGGRAFLKALDFEIETNVAPMMVIGDHGNVSHFGAAKGAAALVQPVEVTVPGQPPLSGAVIKPTK